MKDEAINKVLTGMLGVIEQEKIDLYKKLLDHSNRTEIESVEDFFFGLIYPHRQFLEGLISVEISPKDEVGFLLIHSDYVEHHFSEWIVKREGTACSADKSSTIIRALFEWLKTGKKIEWNYDQEYTYHLPKTIFKTHENIVMFYDGVKRLYYGKPQLYLECIKKLIAIQP
jgi:hypothetical protein